MEANAVAGRGREFGDKRRAGDASDGGEARALAVGGEFSQQDAVIGGGQEGGAAQAAA